MSTFFIVIRSVSYLLKKQFYAIHNFAKRYFLAATKPTTVLGKFSHRELLSYLETEKKKPAQNTVASQGLPLIVMIGLIALSLNMVACKATEVNKTVVNDLFKIEKSEVTHEEFETQSPLCFNERFQQAATVNTEKLDLIFLTDIADIAEEIDAFVAQLAPEVDYQIAVLEADLYSEALTEGLFREDASLAIIDVSNCLNTDYDQNVSPNPRLAYLERTKKISFVLGLQFQIQAL